MTQVNTQTNMTQTIFPNVDKEKDSFLIESVEKWLNSGDINILYALQDTGYEKEAVYLYKRSIDELGEGFDADDDSDRHEDERLTDESRALDYEAARFNQYQ